MTPQEQDMLRRLSINDEALIVETMTTASSATGLDHKTCVLLRIAALVASDSPVSSYQWAIDDAIANGATETEIIDVLRSVAPIVGLARVAAAAPRLALALDYDVEQALET